MRVSSVSLYPSNEFGGFSIKKGQKINLLGNKGTVEKMEIQGNMILLKTIEHPTRFVLSGPVFVAIEDTEEFYNDQR